MYDTESKLNFEKDVPVFRAKASFMYLSYDDIALVVHWRIPNESLTSKSDPAPTFNPLAVPTSFEKSDKS